MSRRRAMDARFAINRHHLLHTRRTWESTDDLKELRENPGMIARMTIVQHNLAHRALTTVPLPDQFMAARTLRHVKRNPLDPDDPLYSMDVFCRGIDLAMQDPRANEFDRRLGNLVIDAVQIQRPFVEGGIAAATVIDLSRREHGQQRPSTY